MTSNPRSAPQWLEFLIEAIEGEMRRQGAKVTGPTLLRALVDEGLIERPVRVGDGIGAFVITAINYTTGEVTTGRREQAAV